MPGALSGAECGLAHQGPWRRTTAKETGEGGTRRDPESFDLSRRGSQPLKGTQNQPGLHRTTRLRERVQGPAWGYETWRGGGLCQNQRPWGGRWDQGGAIGTLQWEDRGTRLVGAPAGTRPPAKRPLVPHAITLALEGSSLS